jgi:hypothetical protein
MYTTISDWVKKYHTVSNDDLRLVFKGQLLNKNMTLEDVGLIKDINYIQVEIPNEALTQKNGS